MVSADDKLLLDKAYDAITLAERRSIPRFLGFLNEHESLFLREHLPKRADVLLYGGYPDESVYMLQNFLNNHFVKLNYQYISTAAIVFAVIVYTAAAIIFIAEKKWSDAIW